MSPRAGWGPGVTIGDRGADLPRPWTSNRPAAPLSKTGNSSLFSSRAVSSAPPAARLHLPRASAAPRAALKVIDEAIQAHGGAGVTDDFGLAELYAGIRTLRLADGPDEVHLRAIARNELRKYREAPDYPAHRPEAGIAWPPVREIA